MSSSSSAAVATCPERPGVAASSGLSPALFRSKLFQSAGQRSLLLCLLLTVVVLVAYNPVTRNGFVNYDDNGYVAKNPHVRAGLTWETVKWSFTTYQQANWHPLTWLSHALDCELFGLHPAGHHYMSVLLHAANVVLLFLLLQDATGFRWRSLMVAALFALHPINVESVAWAAERKNVLSMLFFLLALYAYGGYARRINPGKADVGKAALGRYAAVAGCFALALLSKPQVITFPFLLLLWDYWPLRRMGTPPVAEAAGDANRPRLSLSSLSSSVGWLVLEKVPLFLLSAASAIITMKAQKAGGAVQTFSQFSLLLRLENAAISYARYLGKAFWPSKLVAMYPHPAKLYPGWQVGAAAVLLLLVTALVLRAREQRYLAVGWFWFLGSLVPMIGLVQVGVQAMADRYAYIPFIGLFLMSTWLVADWAKAHKISAKWVAVPAVCCVLVLGTLTYRQVGYWRDSESFWLRTLALTQDNYVAEVNLGDFLSSQNRDEEAAAHFRAALAVYPEGMTANLNLGAYEDGRGNLPAAIEHYRMVVDHAHDVGIRATAYGNLGFVYRRMGDTMQAKQCFEAALQLAPDRAQPMIGLGLIAEKNGGLPEAVRWYARALLVQRDDVVSLLLAHALQEEGHADQAREIAELVASSNLPDARKAAEELLAGK
ncbi:MAG: tetratricopeptide repeat protein [Terriglobales bacterium]